jgi:hypothetical protein
VANRAREAWGLFIAPQKNLSVRGVRDPDMFGLGAGLIQPWSLEPGLGTGLVQFQDLTQVKAKRPGTRISPAKLG